MLASNKYKREMIQTAEDLGYLFYTPELETQIRESDTEEQIEHYMIAARHAMPD